MTRNKKKASLLAVLSVALLCALDQLTKYLVVANMELGEAIPLIKGVFQFRYIRNEGAAWSMLEGKQVVFIILTPIVIFFLGKLFYNLPEEKNTHRCA